MSKEPKLPKGDVPQHKKLACGSDAGTGQKNNKKRPTRPTT